MVAEEAGPRRGDPPPTQCIPEPVPPPSSAAPVPFLLFLGIHLYHLWSFLYFVILQPWSVPYIESTPGSRACTFIYINKGQILWPTKFILHCVKQCMVNLNRPQSPTGQFSLHPENLCQWKADGGSEDGGGAILVTD